MIVGLAGHPASAEVNLQFPEESPGIPAYARIGPDAIHTDEWAVVPFYRLTSCVPADFNLLRVQDIPRVFGCPLTVEGHEVWNLGPGQEPAPKVVVSSGEAVPIWFASWSELQAAMADGVLTIGELSALESLTAGTAEVYHEVLRPGEMFVLNARGTLVDGRTFHVHTTCRCKDGDVKTQITIR